MIFLGVALIVVVAGAAAWWGSGPPQRRMARMGFAIAALIFAGAVGQHHPNQPTAIPGNSGLGPANRKANAAATSPAPSSSAVPAVALIATVGLGGGLLVTRRRHQRIR